MNQVHSTTGTDIACPCCDHRPKNKANLLIHIGRKHGAGWIPDMGTSCVGCKKELTSSTAYYYHAVKCYLDKAPESVIKLLAPKSESSSSPNPNLNTADTIL